MPAAGASLQSSGAPEKRDHFALIVTVCIAFALTLGLAGYKLGRDAGFRQGAEHGAQVRSAQLIGLHLPTAQPVDTTAAPEAPVVAAGLETPGEGKRTSLPVDVRTLQTSRKVEAGAAAGPAAEPRFTLQVQTLGRNQAAAAREMVEGLKAGGFDAFADESSGIVFVGRFASIRSEEARKTREDLKKFRWRKCSFNGSIFVNYPKESR